MAYLKLTKLAIYDKSKLLFLIIYDGATSMTTAYVCNGKTEAETIGHLLEYFETYQLNPKYLVGDPGFMGTELEAFYNRKNIRPITLGPGTPWPNRAEAAVRMYKKQITLMLKAMTEDPSRYEITYRQLLRQASLARNSMVTFGGVSPLEMAFGHQNSLQLHFLLPRKI